MRLRSPRKLGIALLAIVPALTSLPNSAAGADAQTTCVYKGAPAPAWFCYDPFDPNNPYYDPTRTEYGSVMSTEAVPVGGHPWPARKTDADEVPHASLTCDVYRPAVDGVAAPGRFPGIVIYGAYGVFDSTFDADWWATRGYSAMVCDVRGTGRSILTSPGETYAGPFSEIEQSDNLDVIEWMAAQAWSDGRIGQYGNSYYAMTADRVSALRPPHLVTTVSAAPARSLYLDLAYRGGALTTACPVAGPVVAASGGGPATAKFISDCMAHPLYDHFWKQIDVMTKYDAIDMPTLQWAQAHENDNAPGAALENYIGLKRHIAGDGGPWVVGALTGGGSMPYIAEGASLAWMDHWLKQLPGAPLPSARATIQELSTDVGGGGWREFADWPPPDVDRERLWFRSDRSLSNQAGPSGTQSYTVSPAANQASGTALEPGLVYTSAPLTDDLVVAGAPVVHLDAALSASDGIFVVQLFDVRPDGKESPVDVVPYMLKASHRESHEHLSTVEPGQMAEYEIPGWQTHWRFALGHRIRLKLSSGDNAFADTRRSGIGLLESAPSGTVMVASGSRGSYLELPVTAALPEFVGERVAGPFGFEADAEGWTASRTTLEVDGWRRGQPGHDSSQSFQVLPYTDNHDDDVTLTSPKLTVPASGPVNVTFWLRQDTEHPKFDNVVMDWSKDGSSWTQVWASQVGCAARTSVCRNTDFPGFTPARATFTAPAGDLYIRFRMTTDFAVSTPPYTGVAVDDVLIER